MAHNVDILGIEAFVAVADLGSFTRAAEHLHISQTAISRRLSKLEDAIGGKLISRNTRSLALTQPGRDFLPRARRLVRELSAALSELRESTVQGYGHVVIGCLPTIAAGPMSHVIGRYSELHPNNRVQILDLSATEICQAVQQGEAEFGISVLPQGKNNFHRIAVFDDPFVMVCPDRHPLANKGQIAWRDLAGSPLIGVGALSGLRLQTEMVLSENQLDLWFAYEVRHLTTALGLVSGGAGIAILPLGAYNASNQTGLKTVPLMRPAVSRVIEVFRRQDDELSPAALALYDLVLKHLYVEAPP